MPRTLGVLITDHITAGIVEENRIAGEVTRFPADQDDFLTFQSMPADEIAESLCEQIGPVLRDSTISAAGVGIPGIVRGGIVEESPNLQQLKGFNVQMAVWNCLRERKVEVPVSVSNDADVMAAGIAATRGQLDRLIRVWTLGTGIGFGRYPNDGGVWEGGHIVVSLDPKETFCGCGGSGHLEGIMGHRAMRMRFLDMEPDEVFAAAKKGHPRCQEFVKLWHRALAAATASSIHMDGPGKFYVTGPDSDNLDVGLLHVYMQEMVKMSPLQSYVFEVVPGGEEIALIGAAVTAAQRAASA
jgi:predicted NBD/HSP70 family sugar kinase